VSAILANLFIMSVLLVVAGLPISFYRRWRKAAKKLGLTRVKSTPLLFPRWGGTVNGLVTEIDLLPFRYLKENGGMPWIEITVGPQTDQPRFPVEVRSRRIANRPNPALKALTSTRTREPSFDIDFAAQGEAAAIFGALDDAMLAAFRGLTRDGWSLDLLEGTLRLRMWRAPSGPWWKPVFVHKEAFANLEKALVLGQRLSAAEGTIPERLATTATSSSNDDRRSEAMGLLLSDHPDSVAARETIEWARSSADPWTLAVIGRQRGREGRAMLEGLALNGATPDVVRVDALQSLAETHTPDELQKTVRDLIASDHGTGSVRRWAASWLQTHFSEFEGGELALSAEAAGGELTLAGEGGAMSFPGHGPAPQVTEVPPTTTADKPIRRRSIRRRWKLGLALATALGGGGLAVAAIALAKGAVGAGIAAALAGAAGFLASYEFFAFTEKWRIDHERGVFEYSKAGLFRRNKQVIPLTELRAVGLRKTSDSNRPDSALLLLGRDGEWEVYSKLGQSLPGTDRLARELAEALDVEVVKKG